MSIIHEALRKAEREREPRPRGWPLYAGGRPTRRRRRLGTAISLLIGFTMLGGVSLWLGFFAPESALLGGPRGAMAPHPPSHALAGDDYPVLQSLTVTSPTGVEAPSAPAGDHGHLPIPTPLTSETQEAAQAAFERARAAESKGQWEEAIGHYRQALTLNPTLVEAHNNLGALYVRRRQLPAAIDEFRAAIRLDPKYAMVRNNLGSAYILSGEEALAIQEFLVALHLEPTYVSPLYNLASLYARRGDVGQTVAFLTRALALEPAVLSWLQEDSDFDRVKAAPDLQHLYTQAHAGR